LHNPGLTDFDELQQVKIELLKGRCAQTELSLKVEALEKSVASFQGHPDQAAALTAHVALVLQSDHGPTPQMLG